MLIKLLLQHLDHDNAELTVDYSLFEEVLWPVIAKRVPDFENIKVGTSGSTFVNPLPSGDDGISISGSECMGWLL